MQTGILVQINWEKLASYAFIRWKEEVFEEVSAELNEKNAELEATSAKLADTEQNLECTKVVLEKTATEKEEQEFLVKEHVKTETLLKEQANLLLETSEESSNDLKLVHDKLERLKFVENAGIFLDKDFGPPTPPTPPQKCAKLKSVQN